MWPIFGHSLYSVPSGSFTVCYGKWPTADLPIKNAFICQFAMLITRGSNMIFNHQPPLATQWLGRWPTGYPMFTTDWKMTTRNPQKTSKRLAHVGDRQLPRVVFLALFSDRRGLVPEYRGQHRSTTGSWNREKNAKKKNWKRCLRPSLIHWSYMIIIQFPWLKIKKLYWKILKLSSSEERGKSFWDEVQQLSLLPVHFPRKPDFNYSE